MKTPYVIFCLSFIIVILACNKDSLETKPKIKIDKINPSSGVIRRAANGAGRELEIDLTFADKQGDVNDTLYVRKIRRNISAVNPSNLPAISSGIKVEIPDFPNQPRGVIRYTFDFNSELQPALNTQNDTIYFRFVLKDKAGNVSDTLNTKDIIIGN
jgi:hypothetical protein